MYLNVKVVYLILYMLLFNPYIYKQYTDEV